MNSKFGLGMREIFDDLKSNTGDTLSKNVMGVKLNDGDVISIVVN